MSFNPADLRHPGLPTGLSADLLNLLIDQHERRTLPRLRRLWDYYRNDDAGRFRGREHEPARARLAQAQGLPSRIVTRSDDDVRPRRDREVVIENDIAWRVHTLVDFMFNKPLTVQSLAAEPGLAVRIEKLLHAVFDANGGISFFQDLALLGSVYGFIDVLLRVDDDPRAPRATAVAQDRGSAPHLTPHEKHRLTMLARRFALEPIEPTRIIPVLNADDYRRLDAYVVHFEQALNRVEHDSTLAALRRRVLGQSSNGARRATTQRTQVWTDRAVLTFTGDHDRRTLIDERINRLARIPVVHIQNLPQPFFYEGLSEVEPLIPLQDELNTRLSDRANRVTMQSFKMYLGRGIEKFTQRPIGPGQMWSTDNPDASIQEFGGDGASPSEESHINEVRDALDKASAVTPVAAGLLRNKVGNLTSENALRIVMMGLLAKTEKRRVMYGAGIERLCELILHAADLTGVLPNAPEDRAVRIDWPNPLPADEAQHLRNAKTKIDIGVPPHQVLTELGYAAMPHHSDSEGESGGAATSVAGQ